MKKEIEGLGPPSAGTSFSVVSWWRGHMNDRRELGDEWRWWHMVPYAWVFTPSWWRFILAKRAEGVSLWCAARCRWRGHPRGMIYYNPGGYEPNTHCQDCYDDIG